MNGAETEFPLVLGTGQTSVLLRAATATGLRVLFISPLVLHRVRADDFKRQFSGAAFPECVTPQWIIKHGVPDDVELCVVDTCGITNQRSKFWTALRRSKAALWIHTIGGMTNER